MNSVDPCSQRNGIRHQSSQSIRYLLNFQISKCLWRTTQEGRKRPSHQRASLPASGLCVRLKWWTVSVGRSEEQTHVDWLSVVFMVRHWKKCSDIKLQWCSLCVNFMTPPQNHCGSWPYKPSVHRKQTGNMAIKERGGIGNNLAITWWDWDFTVSHRFYCSQYIYHGAVQLLPIGHNVS